MCSRFAPAHDRVNASHCRVANHEVSEECIARLREGKGGEQRCGKPAHGRRSLDFGSTHVDFVCVQRCHSIGRPNFLLVMKEWRVDLCVDFKFDSVELATVLSRMRCVVIQQSRGVVINVQGRYQRCKERLTSGVKFVKCEDG